MDKEGNGRFAELDEIGMELEDVNGGWGGFIGAAETFLTNKLVWTTAKITYERVGGLNFGTGTIVA